MQRAVVIDEMRIQYVFTKGEKPVPRSALYWIFERSQLEEKIEVYGSSKSKDILAIEFLRSKTWIMAALLTEFEVVQCIARTITIQLHGWRV